MSPVRRRVVATLGVTLAAVTLAFGAAAPPERCPDISVADTEAAADAAAGWLIDNQLPDGRWLYEYDRATDTASDDYNVVRHAGVMSSLYQAAARGIDGALESADRGLAWATDHLVERDDWVGMTTTSTIQAGTNALLLAGLAERRLATGDTEHDELMAGLARFLDSQVEPSGALLAYYDLGPDRPRPDTYSIYYTGEAYWALGRLHRIDPDAGWGEVADRMGHYMATERAEAEDVWPPLADHWAGYGLAETAAFPERPDGEPLTEDELEFVRRQGGLIGQRVRSISQRFGPWGVVVRGTFTPRGGGYGVFGEGLTGLWRAASLDARLEPEREVLAERAICITGLGIEAQADAAEAAGYADPDKVEGAWFLDDLTRMDDQQHALSALLLTVPILEAHAGTDGDGGDGHPAPSWWLWLIVVVGTLAPLRAARGIPDRARAERVGLALAGGLLGGAALVLVGSTSGWVLDLLDVSRPAMRMAAAGLCVLSAGIDLVRRPPDPDVALPGRQAALVPVAIPLVVRPALLIAGLSVVADHSVGFHALTVAVAVGATVAATAVVTRDEGATGLVARWVSRLLSSATVVAGVLLVADAVFDI